MKPKLVIFDMDGTMLDTERLSLAGLMEAARVMGHEMPRELFEEMIGHSAAYCRELVRTRYGDDFDLDKAHDIHTEYVDEYFKNHGVPIKPGLFELLDKLTAAGIKKCVATSTAKERATHKLTLAKLANYFETIVGGDEVLHSKPDPEIFLKAAGFCGVTPENCLVLEDSPAGTEGAIRAGMPVILIPDIAELPDDVRAKALRVCSDLFEVAELLSV